jgi:NADH-quinone oxidoreductase subunit L
MRKMGGLRKYMPITWITSLIGTLALVGTPFFSGYYSKDSIILATEVAAGQGGWIQIYAKWAVLLGVFVTSFYSFRLLFLTFHGKEHFHDKVSDHYVPPEADTPEHEAELAHEHEHDGEHAHTPHESPWVVTLPLILLAIPSILIGFVTVGPMVFGDFFGSAIVVREAHDSLAGVAREVWHDEHGWVSAATHFGLHFWKSPVFWLAFGGFAMASWLYLIAPGTSAKFRRALAVPYRILENKYGFDDLWIKGFAGSGVKLGRAFWKGGDTALIDGVLVDGSATFVDRLAGVVRRVQSGMLYHYAFAMILGLIALLGALIWSLR